MKNYFFRFYSLFFIIYINAHTTLSAQPFDTLLTNFQYINEIYPLDDGTFILMGEGEKIFIQRIDSIAYPLWSTSLGQDNEDDLIDYKVHINTIDSSIQVATLHRDCDIYPDNNYTIYTLNFNGQILDSFYINSYNITLLSGRADLPQIGYVEDKDVILVFSNGDTNHIRPAWENGDTSYSELFGLPIRIAMCPEGNILVGTTSSLVFYFRFENERYKVFDHAWAGFYDTRDLLCVDDDFFMIVYDNYIKLWMGDYDQTSFSITDGFIESVIWRQPNLYVNSWHWPGRDTFYVLDHLLNKIYQEPKPDYEQSVWSFAIRNQTTFSVGNGYFYPEGGFLGSENQITHKGPKFYDIELVDFEVGPYDSVHLQYGYGPHYVYSIPDASVTIKNNGDFTVHQIQIVYLYPFSYCEDGSWKKDIYQMELLPGETKSFELHDIFIMKDYPFSQWYGACIYAIRPDNHGDDHFDDNELCKKLDFLPAPNALPDFPIQHEPMAIIDEVRFYAPQTFDFELAIFNVSGIEVFNSKANTSTGYSANLSFLPPGMYVFQYYIPDEHKYFVEKILKY